MWHAKSLLVVDPSVNNCGYSIWNYGTKTLIEYGLIEPGEKTDIQKIMHVAETVIGLARLHNTKRIVIEHVPDTIYNQGKLTRDLLIARAKSVFKTVAVTYTIVGLAKQLNLAVVFVFPVEWQTYLKIRKKGHNIKLRSIEHAQKVMKLYNVKQLDLSAPKKRENIADAINLGYYFFEKECE